MSTRDEIEKWINSAPKCITIQGRVNVDKITVSTYQMGGGRLPFFVNGGYRGQIEFACMNWEEE
jgi:hypothetical protein